jgi:hypothetical protein
MRCSRALRFVLGTALLLPRFAFAQELRGAVRDSASGRPLPSAIVSLLSSTRQELGRTVTSERGEFRFADIRGAQTAHIIRLGFRPRDIPLTAGTSRVEVAMVSIPAMLAGMQVTASANCPRRDDAASAMSLLEQVRTGLLATIVARESKPALMKLLRYQRNMQGLSDRIETQHVDVTLNDGRTTSFNAATSSARLVNDGFVLAGGALVLGPDADVLMSDEFRGAYCFRIDRAPKERVNQVGLGFFREDRPLERIDIEGTLWVDTAARALRDVEFRYVGMNHGSRAAESHGFVSFAEMPNGVVLVDRWGFHVVRSRNEMTRGPRGELVPGVGFNAREAGGETAFAKWPDGIEWFDSLGTLQVRVTNEKGIGLPRMRVVLNSSNYAAYTDSAGVATIDAVFPGTYELSLADSSGALVGAKVSYTARRGVTEKQTIVAPPEADFHAAYCRNTHTGNWMTIRVRYKDGRPGTGIPWDLMTNAGTDAAKSFGDGISGDDGTFGFCEGVLAKASGISLHLYNSANASVIYSQVISAARELVIDLPVQP